LLSVAVSTKIANLRLRISGKTLFTLRRVRWQGLFTGLDGLDLDRLKYNIFSNSVNACHR
jgi:hypothetical protein